MESSYHLHIKSDDRVHPDSDAIIKALHQLFEDKIKESGSTDPSLGEFSLALCPDIHEHAKKRIEQHRANAQRGKEVRQKVESLKDQGLSNTAIAQEMELSENAVRSILDPN